MLPLKSPVPLPNILAYSSCSLCAARKAFAISLPTSPNDGRKGRAVHLLSFFTLFQSNMSYSLERCLDKPGSSQKFFYILVLGPDILGVKVKAFWMALLRCSSLFSRPPIWDAISEAPSNRTRYTTSSAIVSASSCSLSCVPPPCAPYRQQGTR